jgi:Pvc16 N-terminal domain/IPT/TIG domain
MSASTAIGMVSISLRNLLKGEMQLEPEVEVTILAPDETASQEPRINLFLYKIHESAALKNLDWQVKRDEPKQLVPPPLSLTLFYLMTPYARNDANTGNATAHEILGEAMRVFAEHPIVPQAYFVDGAEGLQDAPEHIQIMLNTLDLEELSRVWSTFSQPFRLSVLYEVSVVQLDMLGERSMAKRVTQVGVPDVRAPFLPPVVDYIEPVSGPAGTVINVHGQHLSGWRASVTIMGRLLTPQEITGDTFQVTLPEDLPVGFHEMQIDIAQLHRRVVFFEVTT